jgi:hypothetical protein
MLVTSTIAPARCFIIGFRNRKIDAAETIDDFGRDRVDRSLLGHIAGENFHSRTGTCVRAELRSFAQCCNVPADQCHVGAARREDLRDRPPDAAACAGDQRGLSGKNHAFALAGVSSAARSFSTPA